MKDDTMILGGSHSLLFVFRNKLTGEFVDEDYNPTEDPDKAIGYRDKQDAIKALDDFDEPEEWYIVEKIINMTIVGNPIEVKQYK